MMPGMQGAEFSAGTVVSRAFSVLGRNFIPFVLLTGVVYVPLFGYTYYSLQSGVSRYYDTILIIGQFVLGSVAQGAVTYGVFQQLRGTPASLGQCISVGFSRLFSVIGAALLVGLAVMGGMILLVIPGFIFMCMLWVSIPVAIVEQTGATTALSRSRELTAGHRWSIFGIIFVIGLLTAVTQWVLAAVFLSGDASFDLIKTFMYVNLLVSVVFSALSAVAGAVAYHDLRVAKEGVNTEELAKVFD
jgi:hypothetical protein